MPTVTRTGSFKIGFRRGWSDWQKDLPALCGWARSVGFESLDVNVLTPQDADIVSKSGLVVGTADLIQMGEITHPDEGIRKQIIASNVAYVKDAAALGVKTFFTVMGGDREKKRAENYRIAVESFAPIAEAAADAGAVIAAEGYPGGPPHFTMLFTTPETVRALLKDIPRGLAVNYDPSHLIRLGVDHIRFLKEFLPSVVHVHGKDTELFPEAAYEFGIYQPSAFRPPHPFGEQVWRYTLPGHGVARWTEIFAILHTVNYRGLVSIEMEDENFNTSETGEKQGLQTAMAFLQSA